MASPSYVVVRLHPITPTDADTFTQALDGLTVTAFDVSYANQDPGVQIGQATYNAPSSVKVNPGPPGLPPTVVITYPPNTGIVQHYTAVEQPLQPPVFRFAPVATAIIPVAPNLPEYDTVDLRLEFDSGGDKVLISDVYYNVPVISSVPSPEQEYPSAPPSAYVALPLVGDPNAATVTLPADGSPPNFDELMKAVVKVLSADPGTGNFDVTKLTPDECQNIAYEIAWSLPHPLPGIPNHDTLENMYDSSVNTGATSDPHEEDRQEFEGGLQSYYATPDAIAVRLTRFVYALSAAVACEQMSLQATQAMLEFPVVTGPGTNGPINEARVLLTWPGGSPPPISFGVPAGYFFALGANMPTQLMAPQRYQMVCSDTLDRVLSDLQAAVSALVVSEQQGYATSGGTGINSAGINPAQAARQLAALGGAAATATPQCALNNTLQPLAHDWLAYPPTGPVSPPNVDWRSYQASDDASDFWPTESANQPAGYLDLVLCALTQAFVTPPNPPGTLGDEIAQWLPMLTVPNGLAAENVPTLSQVSAPQWTSFFQPQPDWLPPFTQPGNTAARIAAFIRYAQKFFQVAPASPPGSYTAPGSGGPPTLDLPSSDWLQDALAAYQSPPLNGGPITFGNGFDASLMQQAAATVFPGDARAQAWLVQALTERRSTRSPRWPMPPLSRPSRTIRGPSASRSSRRRLYARGFRRATAAGPAAGDVGRRFPAGARRYGRLWPGPGHLQRRQSRRTIAQDLQRPVPSGQP